MYTETYRDPDIIREELSELDPLLAEHEVLTERYPEDSALKVATSHLAERRDKLIEELRSAEQRETAGTEITIVGRLFDIDFGQRKFKVSSTDGKTITCNKNELSQTQINVLNNQAKYSLVFMVRKICKKGYDKEVEEYIAKSIKVLDPIAYSRVVNPKDASDHTLA